MGQESTLERIDGNLFIEGDVVMYQCGNHGGGCHGAFSLLPILKCYDEFHFKVEAKFSDHEVASAFLRYAQLGYARETFKERAEKIKLPQERLVEGLTNIAPHFQKAEVEYLASGFAPIDFTIPVHPIKEDPFVDYLLTQAGITA